MLKQFTVLGLLVLFICSCNNKNNMKEELNETLEMNIENTENEIYLIIGTYTRKDSKGIHVYKFDTITGASRFISETEVSNPSYLAVSNDNKYIYAVSENEGENAVVTAFSFDSQNGLLNHINQKPTGGDAPCYVSITSDGKNLVTANYSGQSISLFTLNDNGSLNPVSRVFTFTGKGHDKKRQSEPHLHCVRFSPDESFLFAMDLGTDKIYKFKVNKNQDEFLSVGDPAYYKVKSGSGPRHLTFHPNNKYAYLITELSGDVIAFEFNSENGNLEEIQTIKSDTLNARGSADIHVTPDGKFLYASNRLEGDGLAIFSIDQSNGTLKRIGYQETGDHPRNFVITNNGEFLLVANRDTDNVQIFKIDKPTGLLTNTKQDIELSMPVCLKFIY